MTSSAPIADDFSHIAQRLRELDKEAEAALQKPSEGETKWMLGTRYTWKDGEWQAIGLQDWQQAAADYDSFAHHYSDEQPVLVDYEPWTD